MALQGTGTINDPYLIFEESELHEFYTVKKTGRARLMVNLTVHSAIDPYQASNAYLDLNGLEMIVTKGQFAGANYGWAPTSLVMVSNGTLTFPNCTQDGGVVRLSYYAGLQIEGCIINLYIHHNDVSVKLTNSTGFSNCVVVVHTEVTIAAVSVVGDALLISENSSVPGSIPSNHLTAENIPQHMKDTGWELINGSLVQDTIYLTFLSGSCFLAATPLANRVVEAKSMSKTGKQPQSFKTYSDANGNFKLQTATYKEPLLVFAYDAYDLTLTDGLSVSANDVCLPATQNGYKYTCIAAGTTDTLPETLPTSGVLESGTAVFSVDPLIPPVIYGPVTPEKVS